MLEDNIKDKGKFHACRWEVYKTNKYKLIKIIVLVQVPRLNGDDIVSTRVYYYIIGEKDYNR